VRQVKAKRIRREVYGEMADVREYRWKHGSRSAVGLRAKYRKAKKEVRRGTQS